MTSRSPSTSPASCSRVFSAPTTAASARSSPTGPRLCAALELKRVPHFTTLHKAHARILSFGPFSQLLDVSVRRALGERPRIALAAGDSTGLEAGQISPYFVKRRGPRPDTTQGTTQGTTYTRYPKLELLCDCDTHVIVSAIPTLGPRPDTGRLVPLLLPALSRGVGIDCALFDAGYDCEADHRAARARAATCAASSPREPGGRRATPRPGAGVG